MTWRPRIGTVLSLVLNPSLLTGVFFTVLSLKYTSNPDNTPLVILISVLFVALLPIGALFVLRKGGWLSDVEMRVRTERVRVYVICLVSYGFGTTVLVLIGAPWPVWGLMALHIPNTLILMGATRRMKVSVHTMVIGSLWAILLLLQGDGALPWGFVPILAGWGRWAAGAHRIDELLVGGVLGFLTGGIGFLILRSVVGGA